MQSCKLFVHNQDTDNQYFKAVVNKTSAMANESRVLTEEIASKQSTDLNEIAAFMGTFGIAKREISTAIVEMDKAGHNVASFGWMGTFMLSEFQGVAQ